MAAWKYEGVVTFPRLELNMTASRSYKANQPYDYQEKMPQTRRYEGVVAVHRSPAVALAQARLLQ